MPILADSPGIPSDIVKSAGPLLVGYLLTWGLFGVLIVQIYLYYLAFPDDRPLTKSLVFVTFLIELVQTVLVTRDAFEGFAKGFGNAVIIETPKFAWLTMPVMSGSVASIVQIFYAYRIYILSSSKVASFLIGILSVSQFTGAIITGIAAKFAKTFQDTQTSGMVMIGSGIWSSFGSACDIVIAVCMVYYLLQARRGVRRTQALVTRLLLLTTGTGALTATVAVVDLALFFGYRKGTYFLTPAVVLGKLYSNSMMVVLNNRIQILGGRHSLASDDNTIMLGASDLVESGIREVNKPPSADKSVKGIEFTKTTSDDHVDSR